MESIARVIADADEGLTGTEIGRMLEECKMADPTPTMTKWKRLYNAFAETQNHHQLGNHVIMFGCSTARRDASTVWRVAGMVAKVFWIAGPWQGRLGIVPRPRGGEWLDRETKAWRDAGIDIIVSLLEPAEEAELALTGESASSVANGLEFRSFPIPDRGVPESREAVAQLADEIADALHAGKNVAFHCRQGIGRSALIAAAALISGGQDAETAIQTVGQSRGLEVPETRAQRQWIFDFSS